MIVGVMDSGIGGITTLSRLMDVCGGQYVYISDRLGPYGDKSEEFILSRAIEASETLIEEGAKVIVLACNTATNVAVKKLRENGKAIYIGTEPAVKPAFLECKRVCVALTPAAASAKKFTALIDGFGDKVRVITPPSLASAIEGAYMDKRALRRLAEELLSDVTDDEGLVLGCTHYVFLKESLKALRPAVKVFDGNDGVAKRLLGLIGKQREKSVKFVKIG